MPGRSTDRDLTVGGGQEEGPLKRRPPDFSNGLVVGNLDFCAVLEARHVVIAAIIGDFKDLLTLKWSAAKRSPRKYGDRIATEWTGAIKVEEKPTDKLATARWVADMLLSADAIKKAKAKADDH